MPTAPARAKRAESSKRNASKAETSNSSPAAGLFVEPEKRVFVLSLLLVVVTLGIYSQATHFSFVNFDDDRYVTENPHVRAGLSWDTIKWAIVSTDEANWHPLTWISHALDVQLFRLNPAGHHLTSILLHTFSAVLLFLLLWRATRRLGVSFLVALVFAMHPLNVESVAWISERKNVLSTMFFLLTLGAYGWYAEKPGWKRYLPMASLFTAGLASKPMIVTLPFVLLLLDYWPLRRIEGWSGPGDLGLKQTSVSKLLLEKVPLFILSGASSLITMHAQRAAGAIDVLPLSFDVRLTNAVYCYLLYVAKAIWPSKLAPLYPHPGDSLATWRAGLAALFLIAMTGLVLKFRSRGYPVTGWFWFLGTLVPVIGLVQVGNQAMADRYAYIPLIGIVALVVWGFADIANHFSVPVWGKGVVAACCVMALTVVTYRQAGYWRDSLNLWGHALQVASDNFVAENEYGGALLQLGRVNDAYPHFLRAAELHPSDPLSHSNIGAYLHQHGRLAEAVRQYEIAVSLTPDPRLLATTYANLGSAYAEMGNYAEAQDAFDKSIRLNPNRFNTWIGMGLLAKREGRLDEASSNFMRSVELQPTGEAYLQLGRTLEMSGRTADAAAAYGLALKISPDLSEAQTALDALPQALPGSEMR